eukprot:6332473-Pyramimonas_sp.AAC.1
MAVPNSGDSVAPATQSSRIVVAILTAKLNGGFVQGARERAPLLWKCRKIYPRCAPALLVGLVVASCPFGAERVAQLEPPAREVIDGD